MNATEPIRILCVDDETNVLRALERLFLDDDYEIHTASSGKEGLALLGKVGPIQVVISDYRMPRMNGVDFLRQVYEQWPETIRIVLSGYADTASVVSAINEGHIYKFVPKPWNDDELKVTINNAIDLYFLQKRNRELLGQLQESNDELAIINSNLEQLVADQTAELRLQNQVLTIAHNILDAMPICVLGIDNDGMIVQGNEKCRNLLGIDKDQLIGRDRHEALAPEFNAFLDQVHDGGSTHTTRLQMNGRAIAIKGKRMKQNLQEGLIIVFDEVRNA
ncbi:MAG TPA: response regulator [Desulfuromonadales bacterium]|nr:response regulator [Desulfuromonadales bacterium]